MFPHADLFVVFAQQLLADRIAVLGNDPHQAVDILRMIPNEFGKFLHL